MTLRARDLAKHFGGLPAVDGVDLDVGDGEIVALIGPNGAGKSTLLAMIAGLVRPTRCRSLTFDGIRLTHRRTDQIRRVGIATVEQRPRVFGSMCVADDVSLGARFARRGAPSRRQLERTVDEALACVGIEHLRELPVRDLDLHGRRAVSLSRALAGSPRLLLLDEPMAGLGDDEIARIGRVLLATRERLGTAIVWVEHVMDAVRSLADRVVVLDHGSILAEGRPPDVMRDPRVRSAYLGTHDD